MILVAVLWALPAIAAVKDGDSAMESKNYRQAIKQYEASLKKNPNDGDTMVKLAKAYEALKWWGQSVQWWENYLKKFGDGDYAKDAKEHAAQNHRWIGANYYNLGEPVEKSVGELKRSIELDSQLLEAYKWLARIYESEGKYGDAVGVLDQAVKVAPDDNLLAWMLKDAKGKLENGGVAYDKYQQGIVKYEKGDKAGALGMFRDAVKANPDFGAAHVWIARVLYEQGEYAGSIPEWKEALRIDPKNERAAWFLGRAQAKARGK